MDKAEMIPELNKSNGPAIKTTKLQALAEEEAPGLKLTIQAAEMDKQTLQQEAQSLTGIVEFLRNTTIQSVDEFRNSLKLDLKILNDG